MCIRDRGVRPSRVECWRHLCSMQNKQYMYTIRCKISSIHKKWKKVCKYIMNHIIKEKEKSQKSFSSGSTLAPATTFKRKKNGFEPYLRRPAATAARPLLPDACLELGDVREKLFYVRLSTSLGRRRDTVCRGRLLPPVVTLRGPKAPPAVPTKCFATIAARILASYDWPICGTMR